MKNKLISLLVAISVSAFGAGVTPISNLKLIGDANGNGQSITNLDSIVVANGISIGIGSLASGVGSLAIGEGTASGQYSLASGEGVIATGFASISLGIYGEAAGNYSFVHSGIADAYTSHGNGTFNINPVGGLAGLWIGETNMATTLGAYATAETVAAEIEAATSPKLTMVPTGTTVISTDTTVQLVPDRGIYNLYVQGDSDISFDLSSIDITNNVARWETWIKVFAPGMTVGLPSTNAVQYLEIPDLTTTTANELMQISWQAWVDGTNLMMQGHLYNRNTQMPPPTLADLRTYHYGSPTIEESPAEWFGFDSGTGTITGFNYEAGRENVVIPWEIGGVAVEAIGDTAFSYIYEGSPVETLIGPKTVLSIGNNAFVGCGSLTSVSLPAATSIGNNAFVGCGSLTSISLPATTSIGYNMFAGCALLTSISLPVATSIGNNAFMSCGSLTSVSLPVATSIGDNMFSFCTSLTSVSLPAATSIGNNAFTYCGSLTSISLPAVLSVGNNAFVNCASLTSVYFGTAKPTEESDMFYSDGDPINVIIYYPTGASAWSSATTWGGMTTATYTPPAP